MKFDNIIIPNDRGILAHNDDGTYTYVYTTPPTWEITKLENITRKELEKQPYITPEILAFIK